MKGTFDFTVPDGDWDFDPETRTYVFKNLVFTENSWKQSKETIKEYVEDGTAFLVNFTPEPPAPPATVEVEQNDLRFILEHFLWAGRAKLTEIEQVVYDRLMEKTKDATDGC